MKRHPWASVGCPLSRGRDVYCCAIVLPSCPTFCDFHAVLGAMEGTPGRAVNVRLKTHHPVQPLIVSPRSSHLSAHYQELLPDLTFTPLPPALKNPIAGKSIPFSLSTFVCKVFIPVIKPKSLQWVYNNSPEAANTKPAVYLRGGRINKKSWWKNKLETKNCPSYHLE